MWQINWQFHSCWLVFFFCLSFVLFKVFLSIYTCVWKLKIMFKGVEPVNQIKCSKIVFRLISKYCLFRIIQQHYLLSGWRHCWFSENWHKFSQIMLKIWHSLNKLHLWPQKCITYAKNLTFFHKPTFMTS